MPHYYPRHLENFDYIGMHRYFLTFCTEDRANRFGEADAVDVAQSQILRAAGEQGFETTVYCYMLDHAHFLVRGTYEAAEALTFISRAKQYSGFHYKKRFGRRLWQRYGYERVLREDIEEAATIRYIIDNPVRRGLVRRAAEYPFTGSQRYTMRELEQLAIPSDESKMPQWLADEPWVPAEAGNYTSSAYRRLPAFPSLHPEDFDRIPRCDSSRHSYSLSVSSPSRRRSRRRNSITPPSSRSATRGSRGRR